jgi:hypothetical protein
MKLARYEVAFCLLLLLIIFVCFVLAAAPGQ